MKTGYDVKETNRLALAGLENAVNESESAYQLIKASWADRAALMEYNAFERIALTHCAEYLCRICAGTFRETAKAISDGARRYRLFPDTVGGMTFAGSFNRLKLAVKNGTESAVFDAIENFSGYFFIVSDDAFTVGNNAAVDILTEFLTRHNVSVEYVY